MMMEVRHHLLFVFLLNLYQIKHALAITQDICDADSFDVTCPPGQLLVFTSAKYGRMELGSCIGMALGYLGCHADVLLQVERRCAGRPSCTLTVPDKEFKEIPSSCLAELRSYLSLEYTCQSVVWPKEDTNKSTFVNVTAKQGLLASYVTEATGWGGPERPYVITALPGQAINITLLDYSAEETRGPFKITASQGKQLCYDYGLVHDSGRDKPFSICGGGPRVRHLMTSRGREARISFNTDHGRQFAIEFQILGCADFDPGDNKVFTRETLTDAVMKCARSPITWKLYCQDYKWIGNHKMNCSAELAAGIDNKPQNKQYSGLSYGAAIAIIIGAALIVGLIIIAVGICKFRRSSARTPPRRFHPDDPYGTHAALLRRADEYQLQCTCTMPRATPKPTSHSKNRPLPDAVPHTAHAHIHPHPMTLANPRNNSHYSLQLNDTSAGSGDLSEDYEHIWQTPGRPASRSKSLDDALNLDQRNLPLIEDIEYQKYTLDNEENMEREKPYYVTSRDIYDESGEKKPRSKTDAHSGYSKLRKNNKNSSNNNNGILSKTVDVIK